MASESRLPRFGHLPAHHGGRHFDLVVHLLLACHGWEPLMPRHSKKTCPICEGTGKLTAKQAKHFKYALDLVAWAIELQKRVEAEEAKQGFTPDDLQFLADLGIGLGDRP